MGEKSMESLEIYSSSKTSADIDCDLIVKLQNKGVSNSWDENVYYIVYVITAPGQFSQYSGTDISQLIFKMWHCSTYNKWAIDIVVDQ